MQGCRIEDVEIRLIRGYVVKGAGQEDDEDAEESEEVHGALMCPAILLKRAIEKGNSMGDTWRWRE